MRTELAAMVVTGLCMLAGVLMVHADENVRYEDVTLILSVPPKIHLGQDIVMALTLESRSEQSLYSLETADLEGVVEKIGESEKKYFCNRGRIRQFKQTFGNGESLIETIKVKKQFVSIGKGDSSKIHLTMLKDFNIRLSCGVYSVSVLYEGNVRANSKFCVVADYERSVPELIDLISDSDEWTRSWARNNLFSIVGQPIWKPLQSDTKERINSEVVALKKWWEDNKNRVLQEDSYSKKTECN